MSLADCLDSVQMCVCVWVVFLSVFVCVPECLLTCLYNVYVSQIFTK